MIFIALFIILAILLAAPFSVKIVEEELEAFIFITGCVVITITSQWSVPLLKEALIVPLKITLAVFIAGFLFRVLQKSIAHNVNKISKVIGIKLFVFLIIVSLGLLSSIITAIIAALVLVEIVTHLRLERKSEIRLVILSCFTIGLGAALTPIGEPLSTITIANLKGLPHNADFFFLLRHLWLFIISGIVFLGILGAKLIPGKLQDFPGLRAGRQENIRDILVRAAKVYFFVMGLILLGNGFKLLAEVYISKIPHQGLYWLNSFSAVVDNATLAAAEIAPSMSLLQIKSAILSLLIAGGMLIPGNIPNIICAGKLKIKSSEWAKFGVPFGLIVLSAYFFLLIFLP